MAKDKEQPGLGKLIYSVNEEPDEEDRKEKRESAGHVLEADEESFPASDPPSFAGGQQPDAESEN